MASSAGSCLVQITLHYLVLVVGISRRKSLKNAVASAVLVEKINRATCVGNHASSTMDLILLILRYGGFIPLILAAR
jgi:hypothetical protein